MKFDLHKPCRDCPFIIDSPMVLAPGRMQGIVSSIMRDDWQVFPCHKTTHHGEDGDEATGDEQACAGALAYTLKHAGMLPVLARVAIARGQLTLESVQANRHLLEAPGKWKADSR